MTKDDIRKEFYKKHFKVFYFTKEQIEIVLSCDFSDYEEWLENKIIELDKQIIREI